MQKFGEKLRTLRIQRGLSYRQLASELGVHYSHLASIEVSRHKPSTDLVLKIAKYFNVSTDLLMDDELELE